MNPLWNSDKPLVLASGSATRRDMLHACGISFAVDAANIDERALETTLAARSATPATTAAALARAKAAAVGTRHPGFLVLGADQVLDFEGRCHSKASSLEEVATQLAQLSGKSHRLISAASVWRDGRELWFHASVATLTMRTLSPAFIQRYVAACGDVLLSSVGGYQIEAAGIHLFSAIEGDHATILGLPLLALLDFLRDDGSLAC